MNKKLAEFGFYFVAACIMGYYGMPLLARVMVLGLTIIGVHVSRD